MLIEWVLNPDESEVWRPAFKNLQILAEAQPKVYTQFIRPNLIIEIALNYPNSDADTYEKIAPGICEWLCILQWKVEVATYRQSHYREVPRWEIFMEQELRFGLHLGRMADFPAFIASKSFDL